MKKILIVLLGVLLMCSTAGSAGAVPFLQLDIQGGVYDPVNENVVSNANPLQLWALQSPQGQDKTAFDYGNYYISIALVPQTNTPVPTGWITIDGPAQIPFSSFEYGIPPIGLVDDLAPHGIYPTLFYEYEFNFVGDPRVTRYDAQTNPGGPTTNPAGTTLAHDFLIGYSIPAGYQLHFDLYSYDESGIIDFAPFSHDAQTQTVPEPATMLLLGFGLVGLVGFGRKKFLKK